ncbi:MAG: nucleotidyl transferase AbiEii/AbiGii toxin family protein [Patescibacteria group bacterium]
MEGTSQGVTWHSAAPPEATLYGTLLGASASFIAYPFFVPQEPFLPYGNVRVLSAKDIAVMKIVAISQRGRKRDFLDLYWYAQNREPLIRVMQRLPVQYPTVAHDYHHVLKSLVYFDDAEEDPVPRLNFKADWNEVKEFFRREVASVAKELLNIS